MWSCVVVVGPPTPEGNTGLGQRREQRLVQEFVPQAPIEAFDEGILHGFARRDVMLFDAGVISPSQDGVAGEFAAIDMPDQLHCVDRELDVHVALEFAAAPLSSTLLLVLQLR
jgi:hypothetical protein